MPIGGIVMIVHDFPDILVSLFKLASDVTGTMTEALIVLSNVVVWAYCRLWFFPVHVIYHYYVESSPINHYV